MAEAPALAGDRDHAIPQSAVVRARGLPNMFDLESAKKGQRSVHSQARS